MPSARRTGRTWSRWPWRARASVPTRPGIRTGGSSPLPSRSVRALSRLVGVCARDLEGRSVRGIHQGLLCGHLRRLLPQTSWLGSPWSGWASPPSPTWPRWRERADGAAEMSALVPGGVVVCGAGVIGAAVAYFLSRRGIAVPVIERTGVACAASGKSGGFIALDWCDNSELGPLARASFALHARLAEEITTDYGYRRMDTYMVAAREHGTVAGGHRIPAPRWIDGETVVAGAL